jgi:hypothetical protein
LYKCGWSPLKAPPLIYQSHADFCKWKKLVYITDNSMNSVAIDFDIKEVLNNYLSKDIAKTIEILNNVNLTAIPIDTVY